MGTFYQQINEFPTVLNDRIRPDTDIWDAIKNMFDAEADETLLEYVRDQLVPDECPFCYVEMVFPSGNGIVMKQCVLHGGK